MLAANTPVLRMRLERFGQPSVALARCQDSAMGPALNQSAFEPLYRSASEVLTDYRGQLGVRKVVSEELVKISAEAKPAVPPRSKMRRPTTHRGEGKEALGEAGLHRNSKRAI